MIGEIMRARDRGDYVAAAGCIAETSLDQGSPTSRAQWRDRWTAMRSAVPDMTTVTQQSVSEGECVASRYTVTGTPVAPFLGHAPNGLPIGLTSLDMVRVVDGLLVEHWILAGAAEQP
ncbi:putative ester cyclase [Nakamurella sp. UYEF19]|uniref:ester cyclase n=1 Tax=Nakamurella sp. UYEF19 TaxID=1756392 RepID=UPI003394A925